MVTQAQIERIKHLRSQGWTQKRIAEDPLVNMSHQNVAVILKKESEKEVSLSNIKIIHATGFQPKDTVISFEPTEFENLRINDELYATGQDLFELRGGIIHKTTLPPEIETTIYPDIADIISITPHFTYLPDRKLLIEKIRGRRITPGKYLMKFFLHSRDVICAPLIKLQEKKEDGIKLTEEDHLIQQQITESFEMFFSIITPLLPKIDDEYFEQQIEEFYSGMPPIEEKTKLIKYVAENGLTNENVKKSMDSIIHRHRDVRSEEYDFEIVIRAFSSIGISEENIDDCIKFCTTDLSEVDVMKSSSAPTIELMKEMDAEGFTTWSDYQNYLDDFINSTTPIKVDLFENLSSEKSKYPLKIIDAIERDDLDAALTNAWTRFEEYANRLFKEMYLRQTTASKSQNYGRVPFQKQTILDELLPEPENATMGDLIDAVLPEISKENRTQIIYEARSLRNAEQHHGESEYTLNFHHVKAVLEVTEKIIVTLQTLEA
jgi:hypothetical protein